MKHKHLTILLTLLMSNLCIVASAHDFEVDGIYYNITSSTAPLTVAVTYQGDYYEYSNEYTGSVTIPETVTYNGKIYSVTSIGDAAFGSCSSLTSITIPNSVTSIEGYAFKGCSGLTSINIPNSVTSIEGYAFKGCSGLTSINIPNSVTSIGDYAFYSCTGLKSITIPNSVTSIGNYAFYNCYGLTSVTIPCSVISIGASAFQSCTSLKSITIPESVTSIGNYAFSSCFFLADSFINNSALTNSNYWGATIVDEETSDGLLIKDNVIIMCRKSATSITIPNSVTSIGEGAFCYRRDLTYVTIPNGVTSIGERAFYGCTSLTSVTISNSVTSIGSSTFGGCKGLTSVTINNNTIASRTYTTSSTLAGIFGSQVTTYVFGDNVQSIGAYACYNCKSLTSVTIPNSVTSIGNSAFYNCSSLTMVKVDIETPLAITANTFSNRANATLTVPYGCKAAYEAAEYWKEFKEIIESPLDSYIISDLTSKIQNADFSSTEGWTAVVPGNFYALGNGLIGEYKVYGDNAATVDDNHLATEYCFGFECRWQTNFAAYTQTINLPAGNYELSFDVQNVNANTNKANYENRFTVTVGETVYTDQSVEWMNGNSAWTTHTITFSLEAAADVTISLGYGTGTNNFGSANTPILYVSHLALAEVEELPADPYETALAAIGEGGTFFISTDVNGTKYYITSEGKLTSVRADGCIFTVSKVEGNGYKQFGYYINGGMRFTNAPMSGEKAVLDVANYSTSTYNRNTWEAQVLFLDEDGKYAIRASNTAYGESGWEDCGRVFFTWKVEDAVVIPQYTYDQVYQWDFEAATIINVTYKVVESDGVTEVTSSVVKQEANSEVSVPASLLNNVLYDYAVSGTIGAEDCTITVIRTFKAGVVHALTDLSNAKAYTIRCNRGAFLTKDGYLASTAHNSLNNAEPGIFAILNYEDNYYLYSIADQKFVTNTGALADVPTNGAFDAIRMQAQSDPYFFWYFTVSAETNYGLNTNGDDPYGYVINSWMNADGGNQYYMIEAADFDATNALQALEDFFHPSYTLTYKVDGEVYKTATIVYGTTITPEAEPTKEGYTFSGWSEIPETMPDSDVVVTGTFTVNTYKVTYVVDDEEYKTDSIDYGTALTLETEPTKEGYTFGGWSAIPETMPAQDVVVTGTFYLYGDVNTDAKVNVVDVVDIARFVVETPSEKFREKLADLNSDLFVNIADAVVLVNHIAGDQNFAKMAKATSSSYDYESCDLELLAGEDNGLSLSLTGDMDFTAFQFEVDLPEGIDISAMRINSLRKDGHQLLFNKVADNRYRVAALSMTNAVFKGDDGELLNISLEGMGPDDICIHDIHFVTTNGTDVLFDNLYMNGNTTGIADVRVKEDASIYDLQGRRHSKLQRGMNIVGKRKIIVK